MAHRPPIIDPREAYRGDQIPINHSGSGPAHPRLLKRFQGLVRYKPEPNRSTKAVIIHLSRMPRTLVETRAVKLPLDLSTRAREAVGMSFGSVLTAIVTPFDRDMRVDEQALVDLMHHLAEHGSDGFVVCGTTGEAPTLDDTEHLRVIEVASMNRPEGTTVVAGTGSNNTRHAVHMTERATELGVDGILSVTPYYNKPTRRGLVAHFREIAAATDKPIVLYNIPSRVVVDVPNDLLAELAQIERIDYVKQANNANLALVDGLGLYAGNDDIFARTLDLGGCGVISVASHVIGDQMRRMVDEPEHRAEIDAQLRPVRDAVNVCNPISIKAALNLLGHRVGGLRLPLVEANEEETAVIRRALEQAGLLDAVPSA
jgi:4-hydroxy-tetrahydrodipicolinate synthase